MPRPQWVSIDSTTLLLTLPTITPRGFVRRQRTGEQVRGSAVIRSMRCCSSHAIDTPCSSPILVSSSDRATTSTSPSSLPSSSPIHPRLSAVFVTQLHTARLHSTRTLSLFPLRIVPFSTVVFTLQLVPLPPHPLPLHPFPTPLTSTFIRPSSSNSLIRTHACGAKGATTPSATVRPVSTVVTGQTTAVNGVSAAAECKDEKGAALAFQLPEQPLFVHRPALWQRLAELWGLLPRFQLP